MANKYFIAAPRLPKYIGKLVDYSVAHEHVGSTDIINMINDETYEFKMNIEISEQEANKIKRFFKWSCNRIDFETACVIQSYRPTEKLYTLEFPQMDAVILGGRKSADNLHTADATYITDEGDVRIGGIRAQTRWTEKEIRAIDDRYFAFAVEEKVD